MKKKVEDKPKVDDKDVEYFVDRLASILLMQMEHEQVEKEKMGEATPQAQ